MSKRRDAYASKLDSSRVDSGHVAVRGVAIQPIGGIARPWNGWGPGFEPGPRPRPPATSLLAGSTPALPSVARRNPRRSLKIDVEAVKAINSEVRELMARSTPSSIGGLSVEYRSSNERPRLS